MNSTFEAINQALANIAAEQEKLKAANIALHARVKRVIEINNVVWNLNEGVFTFEFITSQYGIDLCQIQVTDLCRWEFKRSVIIPTSVIDSDEDIIKWLENYKSKVLNAMFGVFKFEGI